MSTDHFIESLADNINQFVKQLNTNVPAGKMFRLLRKNNFFNKKIISETAEYSENTSISNVKTSDIATIQTSDPSISMILSLEVFYNCSVFVS
jgi:hypothetical protein